MAEEETIPFDVIAKRPKMWVKVGNQDEIDVEDIATGLRFLDEDSSPALTNTYTDITGIDGGLYNTSTFGRNIVTARFWLHFGDWYDFKLAKHDIYRVFSTKDLIRIRTDASPAVVKYVRSTAFDIKPMEDGSHDSVFTISFENPSGYQYSIVNSDAVKTYDVASWQLGENLPNGQDLKYHFVDQSSFSVYNASDITIDPYYQRHELKIIIKHSGTAFNIRNTTTGDMYRFNGQMTNNDTLFIDGLNSYLNSDLVDNQTNYRYITLLPRWNDFKVDGADDIDIKFSFPFIFLG